MNDSMNSDELQFLSGIPSMKFSLVKKEARMGPDGWPYLFANFASEGESFAPLCQWLSQRGIGLVINPEKEIPDAVLTYGMVWNFKERGVFFNELKENKPAGTAELDPSEELFFGNPTESYLPGYVRKILKQFFLDQGILNPRVLMLTEDQVNFDLAFSVESLDNPPETEWAGIAEAISWFLPGDYSILLVPEKGISPFQGI